MNAVTGAAGQLGRGCNSRMQGGEGELAQGVERKWFGNGTRPSTNGGHPRRTIPRPVLPCTLHPVTNDTLVGPLNLT